MTMESIPFLTGNLSAIFTIIGIYFVKGFLWVIPVKGIYLAAGAAFGFWQGMAVNVIGIAVCLLTAYTVGRCYKGEKVNIFFEKHKKLQQLTEFEMENSFFFSFIVRLAGIIPCDVVSAYCGIKRLPVADFLAGSLLGMMPGMILTSITGATIRRPDSPEFILSVILHIITIILSVKIYNKKKKKG